LRVGLKIEDLKTFTYVDIMKILLAFMPKKENGYRKATQADWDKLM